jgi:hypothetical protein
VAVADAEVAVAGAEAEAEDVGARKSFDEEETNENKTKYDFFETLHGRYGHR